jgi:imidazole glycerol-phosphate synthase
MQILFQSSTEAISPGLGIIPTIVERFGHQDKPVPHIGWNAVDLVHDTSSQHFYFVHSYCAKYTHSLSEEALQWVDGTTQYGQELFISQVKKANVFGTQFHPEKSGKVGLALIDQWLRTPEEQRSNMRPHTGHTPVLRPIHCLTKRVVACMDVRANDDGDLVVTKGDQYDVREKSVSVETAGAVRNLGKPVTLAEDYYYAGADELCLLNITSFRYSPLQDQPMLAVVRKAAENVFVPLTIGGGIKDTTDPDGNKRSALEVAGLYFRAGADKVSIGSDAVHIVEKLLTLGDGELVPGDGTSAIETIAHAYGSQAIVVSIDPKRVYVDPQTYSGPYTSELVIGSLNSPIVAERGKAWWYQCTVSGGRETRPVSVCQLARGAQILGAGELLVNSIDRDGTGLGFDSDLINLIKKCVHIPVIASSGAGSVSHFVEVFRTTNAEAALAAGIFHRNEVKIEDIKMALIEAGLEARRSIQ